MPFYTALRGYTNKRLEEIAEADILVGIPCYNNETTIAHVIQMVTHGLADHYGDKRAVILVADGGSTDDTREVAKEFEIKPWQEKIVSIYRGLPGKGSALRSSPMAMNTVSHEAARACMHLALKEIWRMRSTGHSMSLQRQSNPQSCSSWGLSSA